MSIITKFEQAVNELARRIADTNDNVYTIEELSGYINRAMSELFNSAIADIPKAFPELIKMKEIEGSSIIPLTDIAKNCYKVLSASTDGKMIRFWDNAIYHQVKANKKAFHKPTENNPAMFEINSCIEILPKAGNKVSILYAINPTTTEGKQFTCSDTEEIPFSSNWITKLVEIAETLVRKDMQEMA